VLLSLYFQSKNLYQLFYEIHFQISSSRSWTIAVYSAHQLHIWSFHRSVKVQLTFLMWNLSLLIC
jgi:hypothetical protein